jgi:hypothetical protein
MGETQREQPFHGFHFVWLFREKLIGTPRQPRTDLNDLAAVGTSSEHSTHFVRSKNIG